MVAAAPDLGMAEDTRAENLEALKETVEQLDMDTTPVASSHNGKSDLHDDPIDFWCEDGTINDFTDDGLSHSSVLNREWKRRHDQFHTMGYRDGITAGKEASAQEGFNVGFKQSVHVGYNWGLVRGISSAFANLSDHLKEKLVGTLENRDRLQNLYESVQMISTTDALRMFHNSIQHTETRQSHDHSDGSSHVMTMSDEVSSSNQLDSLFKELISLLHDSPEIDLNIESCKDKSG